MRYVIKPIEGKYYVFMKDRHGNLYDTMRHYDTRQKARDFVALMKGQSELCAAYEKHLEETIRAKRLKGV